MIKTNIIGDAISNEELQAYIDRGFEKYGEELETIDIKVDGEYVELSYHLVQPFSRIRRITGYLVGTLDRFNNAKRAEVAARIKHQFK